MAISVNYPSPVMVNGFSCRNCSDVDLAAKHVDPAHPQDGPFGINAKAKAPQSASSLHSGDAARLAQQIAQQAALQASQPSPVAHAYAKVPLTGGLFSIVA